MNPCKSCLSLLSVILIAYVHIRFAEEAVEKLHSTCRGSITDFVIRVDIMSLADGTMRVNEFESLEACYYSSRPEDEMKTKQSYEQFWINKLRALLRDFL